MMTGASTHTDDGRSHLREAQTQRFQFGVCRPQTVDYKQSLYDVKVVSKLIGDSVDDDTRSVGGTSFVSDSATEIGVCCYYHHTWPR